LQLDRSDLIGAGDSSIPPFASRIALAKLFIETTQFVAAYEVLIGLENEDDEDAQVQYLLGLNLFLKLESAIDQQGSLTGDELRLGSEAQGFLQTCLRLQARQDDKDEEDQQMVEHVSHMLTKLGSAGVPIQAEEEPDQEAADEWEDDSDAGQDVDMAS
jgi:hypothetical protein